MYFEGCQVSGFYDDQLYSGTVTGIKSIPVSLDKDSVYMRLTIKLDARIRTGYADSGYLVLSIDASGYPVKFLPRYTVNRVYNGRTEARYRAAKHRLMRAGLTEAAAHDALGRVNLDNVHHSDAVKLVLDN